MYNKRFRGRGKFLFAFFFPILWLLLSAVVMWLWNAILPSLLHTSTITYWQSVGLLLLCRILFGGFRFNPSGNKPRFGNRWEDMREKWKGMSHEERLKFRTEMRNRCKPKEGERPEEKE